MSQITSLCPFGTAFQVYPDLVSDTLPIISYGGATRSIPYNVPISIAPTSTGGTIPPTGAYAVSAGVLPSGLSIDADTGVISGTADTLDESQAFTVTATNPAGGGDFSTTWTVVQFSGDDGGSFSRSAFLRAPFQTSPYQRRAFG